MTERLLIAIGVHAPRGMDVLPGVDDAVTRMANYARRNPTFDEPIVFSDKAGADNGSIHADDIRAKLTPDVLKNRPRIVVHFCGHGAQLNGNEIWYLTDGLDQWSDRINVLQFRDMLLSHGAKQVCIFSDACQTPASDEADGTPLIRKGDRRRSKFRTDTFRATLRGKPAFAAVDGGPLFSGAVLSALDTEPPPEAAISKPHLRFDQFVVSSQSLSSYIEDLLPDEAAGVRKSQYAEMTPGLNFGEDDYLIIEQADAAPYLTALLPRTDTAELDAVGTETDALAPCAENPDPNQSDHETLYAFDALQSEWLPVFGSDSHLTSPVAYQMGHRLVVSLQPEQDASDTIIYHMADGTQLSGDKLMTSTDYVSNYILSTLNQDGAILQIGDIFVPLQSNTIQDLIIQETNFASDLLPLLFQPENQELGDLVVDDEGVLAAPSLTPIDSNTSDDETEYVLDASQSEWRQLFWNDSRHAANAAFQLGQRLIVNLRQGPADAVPLTCHLPDGTQVFGTELPAAPEYSGQYIAFDLTQDATVLQVGDIFVPLQLNTMHYLSIVLSVQNLPPGSDHFGVDALGWHEMGFPGGPVPRLDPMRALKGLVTGVLGPKQVGLVGAELRLRKHSDPLYGIVAAYLYDRIGDVASIRRMCAFYAQHEQRIPFDIAMLARLPLRKTAGGFEIDLPAVALDLNAKARGLVKYSWQETPAMDALPVSGFAPVLLMGWGRIETLLDTNPTFLALTELRRLSAPTPYPSFRGAAHGQALIDIMNEVY